MARNLTADTSHPSATKASYGRAKDVVTTQSTQGRGPLNTGRPPLPEMPSQFLARRILKQEHFHPPTVQQGFWKIPVTDLFALSEENGDHMFEKKTSWNIDVSPIRKIFQSFFIS